MKPDIRCPICDDAYMVYREHISTHLWVCPDCPAVLFEYYGSGDTKALHSYLEVE